MSTGDSGLRFVSLLLGAALLGSCSAAPADRQISSLANKDGPRCASADLSRVRAKDQQVAIDSIAAACAIIASEDFAREMAGSALRRACKPGATGSSTVSGEDVVRLLRNDVPDWWLVYRKPLTGGAAATRYSDQRILIRKRRVSQWLAGGKTAGAMVNTLVHEWTHLLTFEGEQFSADSGNTGETGRCAKDTLISYASGRAAERVWSKWVDEGRLPQHVTTAAPVSSDLRP